MCRSTGALQVLHLATCYFRGGYPGRPRTLHLREPLVNDRFWCSAAVDKVLPLRALRVPLSAVIALFRRSS